MGVYRKHKTACWSLSGNAKRSYYAMLVREVLLQQLQNSLKKNNREEAMDSLALTYTDNALGFICNSDPLKDVDKIKETEKHILEYMPKWTPNNLKKEEHVDYAQELSFQNIE